MAGQREKPDFVVDPSGRAQDVRRGGHGPSSVPPRAPSGNGSGRTSKPSPPRRPKATPYVIWIPIGLILTALVLFVRYVILSQADNGTFTSERAYNAFQAGNEAYYRGAYAEAIRQYDAALARESDVGDVYNACGLAYHALAEYDRALADLKRALELMPESGMVYNNRALVYIATGDYDRAIADLDRAIELQANFGKAFYNRGLVYRLLGEDEHAIADLSQAVEYSDQRSLLWSEVSAEQRSELLSMVPESLETQWKAEQVRVDLPSALYQRGLAYLATGDLDHALADLRQAAELSPERDDLPEALALALAAAEQTPPATAMPTATFPAPPTETLPPTPDSGLLNTYTWASKGLVGGEVLALAIAPLPPATLYAGTSDGRVFKSTDGGGNWSADSTGLPSTPVQALVINPETPGTLYAATASGVYKSTDGAGTWTPTGLKTSIGVLVIDPAAPATLYGGSDGGGVYKTTDGGANWHTVNTGLDPPQILSLAIDPQRPNTLYAGTHDYTHPVSMRYYPGNLYKSTDGGGNWDSIMFGYTRYLALAVDPGMPTRLYVGMSLGLFKSADGGQTWSRPDSGLTTAGVCALAIDPLTPTTLYAASNHGVYASGDGGMTWILLDAGLTNTDVSALAIDPARPSTVYAGTRGGGVFVLEQAEGP